MENLKQLIEEDFSLLVEWKKYFSLHTLEQLSNKESLLKQMQPFESENSSLEFILALERLGVFTSNCKKTFVEEVIDNTVNADYLRNLSIQNLEQDGIYRFVSGNFFSFCAKVLGIITIGDFFPYLVLKSKMGDYFVVEIEKGEALQIEFSHNQNNLPVIE